MRLAQLASLVFLLLVACSDKTSAEKVQILDEHFDITENLRSDTSGGFARAYRQREFQFPRDHLSHPEFKHEWWRFVGNVSTRTGRKFGYQLSIYRIGMLADPTLRPTTNTLPTSKDININSPSRWRANHYYMAHFSLTDVISEHFYSAQRYQRNALGLAGAIDKASGLADAKGIKLWVEDWVVESIQNDVFPLRITAQNDSVRINFSLTSGKGVILNGDRGLSMRGDKPGNASYYYSMPQMQTRGSIYIDGEEIQVNGVSWLDREWSTTALDSKTVGWDWFGVHLSNGQDLMLYMFRDENGNYTNFSSGSFIEDNNQVTRIVASDISIDVKDEWVSPHTHIRYPASWIVQLPILNLELNFVPYLADQELNLKVNYWEGALRVSGRRINGGGQLLDGQGYAELTGYKPVLR